MDNLPYPSVSRIMKMTAFKSEKHAKGALATLKWLDNGAPHKVENVEGDLSFNMSRYIYAKYNYMDERCGTVCCMAGAIVVFGKPEGFKFEDENLTDLNDTFGLSRYDGNNPLAKLFYPMDFGVYDITPSEAAETLRGYLFSGEVTWN